MSASSIKAIHDLALALKPEGVEHSCDYCTDSEEAPPVADTLTPDDIQRAVADAVAPFQAQVAERDTKIAELTERLGERDASEATAQAVADAVAPLNEKIGELQQALDTAEIARAKVEGEHKELLDMLETEGAAQAAAARRESRIAAVKDTGVFPEDTFDESVAVNKDRIDRWAEMDDVVFDSLIEGWKAKGEPAAPAGNGPLPAGRSALTDVATQGGEPAGGGRSGMRGFIESTIPSLGAQAGRS